MVRQVVSGTLHHSAAAGAGSPRYERYSNSSGEEESKVRDGGLGR